MDNDEKLFQKLWKTYFKSICIKETLESQKTPARYACQILEISDGETINSSSGYPTSTKNKACPGTELPALQRSLSSITFLNSSTVILPRPTSTNVPTQPLPYSVKNGQLNSKYPFCPAHLRPFSMHNPAIIRLHISMQFTETGKISINQTIHGQPHSFSQNPMN